MSNTQVALNWTICPRCKVRPREIGHFTGEMEMYCDVCNDRLAEGYREQQEFAHYHNED